MWHRIVSGGCLLVALPMLTLSAQSASAPMPLAQVITTATGESTVTPDRGTIMFAVETHAATAAAAAAENARRQRSVIDAIHAKGVAPNDVKTAGYSVTTDDRYDSGQRKIVGYVARNTVVVDLPKIDQIGALIDVALGAGANLVSGLRFYSSRFEEARRGALEQAVAKARTDAEVMAKAAGGSLGSALEISSNDMGGPRPVMYEAAMMQMRASSAPETPIAVGEEKVSVAVTIRWQFLTSR